MLEGSKIDQHSGVKWTAQPFIPFRAAVKTYHFERLSGMADVMSNKLKMDSKQDCQGMGSPKAGLSGE